MMFSSREDAGQRLGQLLRQQGVVADIALGLPRGGVVVAAAVARVLELPLDVLVVRKIGHPLYREFAVGALAENGVTVLDEAVIASNPAIRAELAPIIAEETLRLQDYQARFHRGRPLEVAGRVVLLIDDGLATGATMEAAVLSGRHRGARSILVAAPVASMDAVRRLEKVSDQVIVEWADPDFDAVGRYYNFFAQTTDEEVLDLLKAA